MENPSNSQFQKRFDEIAKNYENISNSYTVKRRIEALETETEGPILEVGSATGIITECADKIVICTDISYQMCKRAKSKRMHVVCCDAEMLPFRHDSFDTIISSEMIYYLKNPESFVSYAHKILKSNGKLLISMTNHSMAVIDKIRSGLRKIGIGGMYFDDGLKEFMKLEDLLRILRKENFKITHIENKVIIPFSTFDRLNRMLENSPLSKFGIFIIIKSVK